MFTIYLIGFALSLVAANPIVQRIPTPGQTCPAPTCSTCPTQACPNTSRPALCQTCQNPYRNLFNSPTVVLRQANNNCPCNKPVTVQNAVANPPISQEALTQLILTKLLSPQPPIQVLNPPMKACSQSELEPQKPAPNIINNYIIIPPEYFKGNETKVRDEERVDKKRKGRRRKQSRQRNQQKDDAACSCVNKDELNHHNKTADSEHDTTPCPCDKDNNTSEASGPVEIQDGDVKYISGLLKSDTVDEKIVPTTIDTGLNNTGVIQNYQNILINEELSTKTSNIEPKSMDTENPKRRNRNRTKNIEEAIIRDFRNRHPTIPEEIARSLLKNLKQYVEIEGKLPYRPYPSLSFGQRDYYPPMSYPEHENRRRVQSHRRKSDRVSRRRKPHRSGRRNNKPKEETKEIPDDCDKKYDKLIAVNPAVINIETETITTEKIIATTENKLSDQSPMKDSETQMETPDDLIDHLEQIKEKFVKLNEIETTTVNYNKHIKLFPELGKEDKVPTVYDNGVDDYYPDFRSDNIAFYASNEECDFKQDKYHYTTDRNGGPDCKRYVTMTQHTINSQNSAINNSHKDENGSECSVPMQLESDESYEEPIRDDNKKNYFRAPPHLELPDFETKQIKRISQELNEKFVTDDLNTVTSYSDVRAESRPGIELKPAKVFTKDKTGRTNIETVFGHSKVVRYGHDAQESDPVITYYLPEEAMTEDRIQLPDGEKAVVVAKSIRDLVDSWESI